jgi:hypothetical protein
MILMPQFKTLRKLKKKEDSPVAKELLKEIEKLEQMGNKERAKLLKKRYKQRYALCVIADYLKNL